MGWESQAVTAAIVLVKGSKGGIFVYDSSGHLVESMAASSDVDPETHSNQSGTVSYSPAAISTYVQMLSAAINFHRGTETQPAAIEEPAMGQLLLEPGEVTGGDVIPNLQLFSTESPVSSSGAPSVLVSGTGSTPETKSLFEVQGSGALIPGNIVSAITGTPGLTVGGPAARADSIVAIGDDPTNARTLGSSMLLIVDQFNAPIFDVPPAGGPKTFGDFMGVWLGVFSGATCQMLPWGGMQPSGFTTIGGSAPSNGGAAIYAGPGAPPNATIVSQMNTYMAASGAQAFSQQGDMYIRTDGAAGSWLYRCSVSGTALAPGGTWVNMV